MGNLVYLTSVKILDAAMPEVIHLHESINFLPHPIPNKFEWDFMSLAHKKPSLR